ncbi:MAG TPA: NUDIX domain-containing protein [Bacteroidia bacterium]|nr:NUDIX domain-containing protein [Bacteroidia bacterium]
MKIQIQFFQSTLLISDEKSDENLSAFTSVFNINDKTTFSEIDRYIAYFLQGKFNHQYYALFFESNLLLMSFLEMYLPNRFNIMYAAGGLIHHQGKGYLWMFKRGKWDLPKGKIDSGEKAEDAAIRECIEETGVSNLKIEINLGLTYHIFEQKEKYNLKITQWFLMSTKHDGQLIPQTEEGISKLEWIKENDLSKEILPNTYSTIIDILQRAKIISEKI